MSAGSRLPRADGGLPDASLDTGIVQFAPSRRRGSTWPRARGECVATAPRASRGPPVLHEMMDKHARAPPRRRGFTLFPEHENKAAPRASGGPPWAATASFRCRPAPLRERGPPTRGVSSVLESGSPRERDPPWPPTASFRSRPAHARGELRAPKRISPARWASYPFSCPSRRRNAAPCATSHSATTRGSPSASALRSRP